MQTSNSKIPGLINLGILSLPITVMLTYGLFGFRSGQLLNKTCGVLMNLFFVFNVIIVTSVGLGYIISHSDEFKSFQFKMFVGYIVLEMINFTLLFYKFYKKYNVYCLLLDILCIKMYTLTKQNIIYVLIMLSGFVAVLIYIFIDMVLIIIDVFTTGKSDLWEPFLVKTDDPLLLKILVIPEHMIFGNQIWAFPSFTSFMICVIAIVLSREFDGCVADLQSKCNKNKYLNSGGLFGTIDRFYELASIVHKVDEMFSVFIGLNLTAALGMLCGAIYGVLAGEGTLEEWSMPVMVSIVTLILLLPSVASLNSKVRLIVDLLFQEFNKYLT